jgi:WD40 repeat protein
LAFSPDGRYLATGARQDREVKIWDASTGKLRRTLKGHIDGITGFAFSPDSKRLGSASVDGTVWLWDLDSGKEVLTFREHEQSLAINGLAFGADGQHVTSVSVDGVVKVWEAATGATLSTCHGDVPWVSCAAFSHDGRWLALGSVNGNVKVYQTDPWKEVRTLDGHPSEVHYLTFSPVGDRLASAGKDHTLKVWDMTTGHEAILLDIHTPRNVTSLAFSPDGYRLASGSADNTVIVSDGTPWVDIETGEGGVLTSRFTWIAHDHRVVDLAFSPDSQRLISAGWDKTVKVWDLSAAERGASAPPWILTVPGLPADLTGLAVSSDGQRFAVSSLDGTVTICDAHSGEIVHTLQNAGPVYGVAFNPKSDALASAHYDGTVKVWNSTTGKAPLTIRAHADSAFGVSYSADGRLLATAGGRDQEKNIGIWEASTGKLLHPFRGDGFVRSVAFSPDRQRLASTLGIGVSLLDVEKGQELVRTPPGDTHHRVVFSPDGRYLATPGEGQTVRLLDAATLDERDKLHKLRVSGGELWGVAFSPNGRYLATCSGYKGKGTIQIWDRALWDVRAP